jgi:hypothetical protein
MTNLSSKFDYSYLFGAYENIANSEKFDNLFIKSKLLGDLS